MAWRKDRLLFFSVFLLFILFDFGTSDDKNKKTNDANEAKEKWKKKDVRDYSDADLERLFDQWEENDEDELEEDELPEWKREPPKVDMSNLDPSNPEAMLKMSKKGRTLMMFATVSGNPTKNEADKITSLWHSSLHNAHYDTQRYLVSDNRVIFMLKDGSDAWEIKDYLIKQDRCEEVTIEGKSYPGKGAENKDNKEDNRANKKPESKPTQSEENKIKKKKEEL